MKTRIVLIGSGNLAEQLAIAIARCSDLELVQLFARNVERGAEVARLAATQTTDDPERLAEADLYLIAVSDRAIEEVAERLPIPNGALVAHTAGCVGMDALRRYPHRAVFYPFQGFSKGRPVDFRSIYLFLEAADPADLEPLRRIAGCLSNHVEEADSARRAYVHLSGVLCNNFTNALYAAAAEQLRKVGLGFEVLKPLIAETAAKALAVDDPVTVQTGPARRGDRATQERHLALLDDERLRIIYESISQTIWETSKKI